MGKKKFIDKKSSKTYKLVYRSQQDPLSFEENAGPGILAEVAPPNLKKKKAKLSEGEDIELETGETAALYGVYADDLEYNYLNHLKPINVEDPGVTSVILEATKTESKKKNENELFGMDIAPSSSKKKVTFELPEDMTKASIHIMDIKREAVPSGLELDMDPDVREALDALEHTEDYESASDIDDLMEAMDQSGSEGDFSDDYDDDEEIDDDENLFKRIQQQRYKNKSNTSDDELSYDSDDYDDFSSEKNSKYQPGPKSNFSMTSSVMYRNENLTLLDDQFDQLEQEYANMDLSDSDHEKSYKSTRPDFEQVIDKYYNNSLPEPVGGVETLDSIRKELNSARSNGSKLTAPLYEDVQLSESARRPLWDAESIISSYSNLDNHPIMIKQGNSTPKIKLTKSGFPLDYVNSKNQEISGNKGEPEKQQKASVIFIRPKNEPKEEKNLRKMAAKQLKKERQVEKKNRKLEFDAKKSKNMQSKNDKKQLTIHID